MIRRIILLGIAILAMVILFSYAFYTQTLYSGGTSIRDILSRTPASGTTSETVAGIVEKTLTPDLFTIGGNRYQPAREILVVNNTLGFHFPPLKPLPALNPGDIVLVRGTVRKTTETDIGKTINKPVPSSQVQPYLSSPVIYARSVVVTQLIASSPSSDDSSAASTPTPTPGPRSALPTTAPLSPTAVPRPQVPLTGSAPGLGYYEIRGTGDVDKQVRIESVIVFGRSYDGGVWIGPDEHDRIFVVPASPDQIVPGTRKGDTITVRGTVRLPEDTETLKSRFRLSQTDISEITTRGIYIVAETLDVIGKQ